MKISRLDARRIAIHAQGLNGHDDLPTGIEGVAQTVERLGYVQLDTISVVQRAHHHILWSRRPDYTPEMLDRLQAVDRRVFEYWAHAAAFIPMRDYRYYVYKMRAYGGMGYLRNWREANAEVVQAVLDRIRDEGALGSSDFEAPEGYVRGTWWSWKPAKRALETLFSSGELMVTARRGFQRLYDLPERVLPPGLDATPPPPDELARYAARRTLQAHGVLAVRGVHWSMVKYTAIPPVLDELVAAGEVVRLEIEGVEGKPHYALTTTLEEAAARPPAEPRLHILSPFDNLISERQGLEWLFQFDYRIGCYTPAAQRPYGYFDLPILWGDTFVARVDCKAERSTGTLIVRGLYLEPGAEAVERWLPALATKLHAFAAFNGCTPIIVERTEPANVRERLVALLAQEG